jgi:hypothetical protein
MRVGLPARRDLALVGGGASRDVVAAMSCAGIIRGSWRGGGWWRSRSLRLS